jgi:predicted DNA-binding transcriptional regulator YafY
MDDRVKKTERLMKIWILLANNPQGYTARDLARRFEVNERTIYRDFTTLGAVLMVPVYDDNRRWKMDAQRFLPPIRFTLPEALNIFLSSRLMLGYSHRYDANVEATFTKLSSVLPGPLADQVRNTMDWMQKLPKDERYLGVLATVAEAWVSQRQLKIVYRSLDAEEAAERVIEPYYIEPAASGHASYVLGYCHLRKALRMFKIERIEKAELTAELYTIPSDFDANEFFGSSWGIVVEGEVKTVKLKIENPKIMRLMSETVWHPSQTFEKRKDGSLIMTLKVTDTHELFSWILSWGDKVKVLEPEGLRLEIIKTAKAIQVMYNKNRSR